MWHDKAGQQQQQQCSNGSDGGFCGKDDDE